MNFAIAGFFRGALFMLARINYREASESREAYLVWGFGIGFSREVFMIVMAVLQSFGVFDRDKLHEVFPPLQHAFNDFSLGVIGAAYLLYLLEN